MDIDTFYRRIVLMHLALPLRQSVFLKKETGVVSEHPIYYKAQVDTGLFVVEGYVMPADSSEEDLTGYTEEVDPIEDFEQHQAFWFTARRWIGAKDTMTRGWALLHGEHGQKFNIHAEVANGEALCFSCAIHVDALDRLQGCDTYYRPRGHYTPSPVFGAPVTPGDGGSVAMTRFGPVVVAGGGGGSEGQFGVHTYIPAATGGGQASGTPGVTGTIKKEPYWVDQPTSDDRTMKEVPMTGINLSDWKPPMVTELPRHQRSHNCLIVTDAGQQLLRAVIEGLPAETTPAQASLAIAENGIQFKEYVKGEGNDHDTVYFSLNKQPTPSVMPSPLAASLMNEDVHRVQRQLHGFVRDNGPWNIDRDQSGNIEDKGQSDPALQDPTKLWAGRFVQDSMPGADGGGSGSKVSLSTDDVPKDEPPPGTTPTGA